MVDTTPTGLSADKPSPDCLEKPWVVKGIAMVPVEVEMVVMARTSEIAENIAQAKFKACPRDYIVANSYDDSSAHDWVPFASPSSFTA